jgi:hypothetical protein
MGADAGTIERLSRIPDFLGKNVSARGQFGQNDNVRVMSGSLLSEAGGVRQVLLGAPDLTLDLDCGEFDAFRSHSGTEIPNV